MSPIPSELRDRDRSSGSRSQSESLNENQTLLIDTTRQQSPQQPVTLTFKTVDPETNREEIITVNVENSYEILHAAQNYGWEMKTASGKSAHNLLQFGGKRRSAA